LSSSNLHPKLNNLKEQKIFFSRTSNFEMATAVTAISKKNNFYILLGLI